MEHPVIGVRPLDAHARFIAGDDPGLAQDGQRLVGLDLERRMGTNEHVHQRALADAQAQHRPEHAAQAFIRHQLKALEIDRKRVNAWTERRRLGNRRRRTLDARAAKPAGTRETPVTRDVRLDRRNVDLVVFADQLHRRLGSERAAAPVATGRLVVDKIVGIVAQFAIVRLVSRLRSAWTGVLPLFLLVRRRRFRRSSRSLLRVLQTQNQVDQLFLAQLLQITSIHCTMDSDFRDPGKRRNHQARSGPKSKPRSKKGWVIASLRIICINNNSIVVKGTKF
jgi:hypothetical protein